MKYIRISVAGSIDEPIVFLLHRGVTARQVLSTLRLKEHVLFTLPTCEQPASPFLSPMDVYPEVRSGDFLLAVPAPQAEELSVRQEVYETPF
jgi:hypothetical protein